MLGTSPNSRSTTASSNSPVAGSPVLENATAPAAVSAMRRAAPFAAPGRLPILRLAGDELAILVAAERHRHEVGHVRQGFSPLSRALASWSRGASVLAEPVAEK